VSVRVPPEYYDSFTSVLGARNIKYVVIIDNLQKLVDEETNDILNPRPLTGKVGALPFDRYNSVTAIHDWLRSLKAEYPELEITYPSVGNSYEGWPLLTIKIVSKATGPKNIVWFDGGIHAREWISPATVTWMLNAILEGYKSKDPEIVQLVDGLEIYVLPLFNPDGYDFTFPASGKQTDRMWRKTRRPNTGNTPPSNCIGTDPNRNWNNHWSEQGISFNPCAETYCGPWANSEREVEQVSDFLKALNSDANGRRVRGYINFHAYSQLWLSPFGYTGRLPGDNNAIQTVGRNAAAALRVKYGTAYTVGPIFSTIYPASGSSADFAYEDARIPYSYAPELRPIANNPGFILPPAQIVPSGRETFDALKVWMKACLPTGQ